MRRHKRCGAWLLTVGLVAAVAGCQTYVKDYRYAPSPQRASVPKDASTDAGVQALVSLIGIRYPDRPKGAPASVDVRLRLTNRSDAPATLAVDSLQLVGNDLSAFPEPVVYSQADPTVAATRPQAGEAKAASGDETGNTSREVSEQVTVPAGTVAAVMARFPLPGKLGDIDLNGLSLEWTLRWKGERHTRSFTFNLQPPPERYYGGPYWYERP